MKRTALVAIALVVALFGTVVPATSAQASTRVLCVGYNACAKAGYTNHGYKAKRHNLYWRMAGDHNCTNYVAYLLVKKGMTNVRPWVGDGNAYAWGDFTEDYSDSTPVVGAVAWWDKNRAPASATGHVSYVERVISKNEIIVSEDNWKGEFRWKRITKSGGGWPSAFIHFKDKRTPALPTLRAASVNQAVFTDSTKKISVTSGAMRPGSTAWVEMTFRNTGAATWKRATLVTEQPSALSAAWLAPGTAAQQKEATVAPGKLATFGFTVTIPMDATPGTIFTEKFSPRSASGTVMTLTGTSVLFGADDRADFATRPTPTISGTARQGQLLTATAGAWPDGANLAWQWKRDGVSISGARAATYTVAPNDIGRKLTVSVTATAEGYLPSMQTSAPTAFVRSIVSDRLTAGQRLRVGDEIVSQNGRYSLTMRDDGNLVIYDRLTEIPLWASATAGTRFYATFSKRGSLAVINFGGTSKWSSGSTKATRAVISNTGFVALYTSKGAKLWSSSTSGR